MEGSLYYRLVNYTNKEQYYPSWSIYPFTFTESIHRTFTIAYDFIGEDIILEHRDSYLNWVLLKIKEDKFWTEVGIPFVGVNEENEPLMYSQDLWGKDRLINSEEVLKMIYGLSKWDSDLGEMFEGIFETPLGNQKLSKWYIPQYVRQNGFASFQGVLTVIPETYLLLYVDIQGREEIFEGVLEEILKHQRLAGDEVSKGIWRERELTNIKDSLITIEKLIYLGQKKRGF